jgi:hypothetical protein
MLLSGRYPQAIGTALAHLAGSLLLTVAGIFTVRFLVAG